MTGKKIVFIETSGFLVKLMIVVIIVGVVSAMLIPIFVKHNPVKKYNDTTITIKQNGK